MVALKAKRPAPRIQVRSGGQSGVDRAALDVAIELHVAYGGWCPRGGWAEDFPRPPGLLARYPHLEETPLADPKQRTAWNVRDSDATLLLVRSALWDSPGAGFTRDCAELVFQKPLHPQDLGRVDAVDRTLSWLASLAPSSKRRALLVLNVAGPRESESPGIYDHAVVFLRNLLRVMGEE